MKVLLSNVSRKNGYMIIDVFFSVLSGMNYPVLAHDDTMLKFIDEIGRASCRERV